MRPLVLLIVVAWSVGCGQNAASRRAAVPATSAASRGLVPAADAAIDPATGLPTRVLDPGSGITLVLIPAGEFVMGSPESDPDRGKRERQHRRVIRQPFYLGETEVTVAQFRRFVEATGYQTDAERGEGERGRGGFAATPEGDRDWNEAASWKNPFPGLPEFRPADDHPVIHVSWNDARRFCDHFGLSLPTEAQWEYAARAGSMSRYPWGESDAAVAGYANVGDESLKRRFDRTNVYFPFDDGHALIAPVGRYEANDWGLRDMIGNVEEWCLDVVVAYPNDGADASAAEGDAASARVLRGGSWLGNQGTSRSATRIGMLPSSRRDFQGFRVAAPVSGVSARRS